MILLDNNFSSIPVAIELGRLVFDNLKKVVLYLMPVRTRHWRFVLQLTQIVGRYIHRVHDRLCQCVFGHADCSELLSPSVFLNRERCGHVYLPDVREA